MENRVLTLTKPQNNRLISQSKNFSKFQEKTRKRVVGTRKNDTEYL